MIKIFGPNSKKQESSHSATIKHKSAAEIRLQKEISELELPKNISLDFPDENDIMNFKVLIQIVDQESM